MKKFITIALAGLMLSFGVAAQASTVEVESFDTLPSAPMTSWSNNGYTYTPTTGTNGQCYENSCLMEYNSAGVISTLTENNPPRDGIFNLLGFYVNVNGKVNTGDNLMSIDSATTNFDLTVLQDIAGSGLDMVAFNEAGASVNSLDFRSGGFFIAFTNGIFDNITYAALESLSTGGQIRIDCVATSHDGGHLSSDYHELTSCLPSEPLPVPVPATLPLLASAIGLAGLFFGRKARKS